MTVVDLNGSGDLMLHSPIQPTPKMIEAINQLGKVNHIISPNLFHYLFVKDFAKAFPQAKTYCAPGLEKKIKGFTYDEVIEENKTYPWSDVADFHVVNGSPLTNEVIFNFRQQKTLLVTDIGIHICESSPFLTRFLFKLLGAYKRFGWVELEKKIFIKDRTAFQQSMDTVLKWDFDKIILSHGDPVLSEGHSLFAQSFQ